MTAGVTIEQCLEVRDDWVALRGKLWPEYPRDEHRRDAINLLARGAVAVFLAVSPDGAVVGFAEASLRHDFVNGCDTSPVTFLEGIYVEPAWRKHGIARALCAAVGRWGIAAGCTEFASDSMLDEDDAHVFHRAVGFEETERVVYFRKSLRA